MGDETTTGDPRNNKCPGCGALAFTPCAESCTYMADMNALAASTLEGLTDEEKRAVMSRPGDIKDGIGLYFPAEIYREFTYILRALTERCVSSTDSSYPFCQAYGDEPHGTMEFDDSHECITLTAQKLLAAWPDIPWLRAAAPPVTEE